MIMTAPYRCPISWHGRWTERYDAERGMTMKPDPEDVRGWPVNLRVDRPHPARIYDYLLGGKDNFAADRSAAEEGLLTNPNGKVTARENRAFMRRVVRYLVTEAGIRQFLDVGTGLPTSPNVHEIAQSVAPDSKIVYVDNDCCKSGCAQTRWTGQAV
jgi:hypothetical protein